MKYIRKVSKPWLLLVAFVFFITSCGSSKKNKIFKGEELFKGIFFGAGDFAKSIPQYEDLIRLNASLSAEERTEFERVQNYVVENISRDNEKFFNEFSETIQSGDQVKIRELLQTSATKVQQHLNTYYKISSLDTLLIHAQGKINTDEFKRNGKLSLEPSKISSLKAQLLREGEHGPGESQMSPVIVYAVAVAVAVVVAAAFWWWVKDPGDGSETEKEMIINSIAVQFKHQ